MRVPVNFILLVLALAATGSAQDEAEPLRLDASITFEPGRTGRPLVVRGEDLVIDGRGLEIVGPGRSGDRESFRGEGIRLEGCCRVTLRRLKVHGFRIGLRLLDCEGLVVEDCDFGDNYHDPDFGWGDFERVGGIIADRLRGSTFREVRAARVWNGLDFRHGDDNRIERCDLSHCSNVGLKLAMSSRNVVVDSDISWGLRIAPGEVHARDSTGVLIESGSDENRFERNDVRHGGDGIFIRVLNGWCSRGNVFVENDCSHANNNGFESWAEGNVFIRNRANHCSYGFWLGGSDRSVLIGNEAAFNGREDGFHNAPEAGFGHGGIVFAHGSGTHSILEGNHCHDNAGGGIVFQGDLATRGERWRIEHLLIQRNRLERNTFGIYGRFGEEVILASNRLLENGADEHLEGVTDLLRLDGGDENSPAPGLELQGPRKLVTGEIARFSASARGFDADRNLRMRWLLSGPDGGPTILRGEGTSFSPRIERPGFHRLSCTVDDGRLAATSSRDLLVVATDEEALTETDVSTVAAGGTGVTLALRDVALVGTKALEWRAEGPAAAAAELRLRAPEGAGFRLGPDSFLEFWMAYSNEDATGFQGPNPRLRLGSGRSERLLVPKLLDRARNLLLDAPYAEARSGWLHVVVPVSGDEGWFVEDRMLGEIPPHVSAGLRFETLETPIESRGATAMAAGSDRFYLLVSEGERLYSSRDGRSFVELPGAAETLGGAPAWRSGGLAYAARADQAGSLYCRREGRMPPVDGRPFAELCRFDIETGRWSWTGVPVSGSQGATILGSTIFSIACSRLGDYGGALTAVELQADGPRGPERRSMLRTIGESGEWFGPASRLAALEDRVFALKNDWTSPAPELTGDRLLSFLPGELVASKKANGDPEVPGGWEVGRTPCRDHGALPFEIGEGAVLVALPPRWCAGIGAKGGLFVTSGNSPSDQDGRGKAGRSFALHDLESGRTRPGVLPGAAGSGTSAVFFDGALWLKRGGSGFDASNRQFWVVRPQREEPEVAPESSLGFDLAGVREIVLELRSAGEGPWQVRIDGFRIGRREKTALGR